MDRLVKDVKWQDDSSAVARVLDGFYSRLIRVTRTEKAAIDVPHWVGAFDVAHDGSLVYAGLGFDRMPEVFVKRPGEQALLVSHLNDAFAGIELPGPEVFKFASFDGVSVEAALMRPAATNDQERAVANRRGGYPLVLLVHGGPAASFVPDYWLTTWAHLLAARGYGVLMVNPRGSVGYGEQFVKANRGDLGGGDYQDLMMALDIVLKRGEADPSRLGVGGWSYGGQQAMRIVTQTQRFKAAVAGAGVFDEAAEYGTENAAAMDEWYMGIPSKNREVYAQNSPATFIAAAKTPMLILHGIDDPVNPIGQSQALYRALKWYGVESQFVSYPREGHSFREEGHRVDALKRMLAWFDEHL